MFTRIALVAVAIVVSSFAGCGVTVGDLNPPERVIGHLGKPLGTRMTIEGVEPQFSKGSNVLAISKIDGHAFEGRGGMEIRGDVQIQKDTLYRLEGCESGEFDRGLPDSFFDASGPRSQQPFQFCSFYVVTKLIEASPSEKPKGNGFSTLGGQTEREEPPLPAEALQSVPQYSASMPAATSASVFSPDLLDVPPTRAPVEPPVSANRAFTDLRFTQDCQPGTKDDCGRWIAGTETMCLLQHQGKLFVSTEVWTDKPYFQGKGEQPWTGSQILVKESVRAPWRVDMGFPSSIRLAAMISATFITDGSGRKLDPPVTLLIASPSSENTTTWTRDDASGKWNESMVQGGLRGGLRSFCTHLDAVTKVQYLFGGSGGFAGTGSVFRAVHDLAAPGHILWHEAPELSGVGRVMCMAEANGVLYAACGIKSETPSSGGLFRRVDGEKPRWELLWRWPHKIQEQGDELEIMRGLTAVSDPKGGAHQVLLGTCNYPGVVYRIDPSPKLEITTELDIRAYFAKAFGVSALRGPCLSAYNNFLPVTDPDTREKIHLLGVWINYPGGHATDLGGSAWYLIRHSDGSYGYGRVFDPDHPRPNPPRGLLATRTIEVSPFPEDKGRTLYFGGYDCASIESHNTAWIYKGTLRPVESKEEGR